MKARGLVGGLVGAVALVAALGLIPVAAAESGGTVIVERLGGWDRYETSALIADAAQRDVCEAVNEDDASEQECLRQRSMATLFTLVRGDAFADALSASNLDMHPILLTHRTRLPDPIVAWLSGGDRSSGWLRARVAGQADVVADSVIDEVRERGFADNVERVGGPDRYATAVLSAQIKFRQCTDGGATSLRTLVVTSGTNWPDGVAAAGVWGPQDASTQANSCVPILLTRPDRLPQVVRDFLAPPQGARPASRTTDVVVVGGPAAVSPTVIAELQQLTSASVRRLAGTDRVRTALAVAEEFFLHGCDGRYGAAQRCGVLIARADDFPDAISAASLMQTRGSPLLLAESHDQLGEHNARFITDHADRIEIITVLGSEEVVGETVLEQAQQAHAQGT